MDREEALRLLNNGREGVAEWNRRRAEGEEIPSLDKIILTNNDLTGINLAGLTIIGASLEGVNLSRADLTGSDLSGSFVARASFVRARLMRINLTDANLSNADLTEANLTRADLSRSDLTDARLTKAKLSGAKLIESEFRIYQRFVINIILHNILTKLILFVPYFTIPCKLDDTRIERTRFSASALDPWSILRRTYSGPKYAFLLLFTFAALMPLVIRLTLWIAIDRAEEKIFPLGLAAIERIASVLKEESDNPSAQRWSQEAVAFVNKERALRQRSLQQNRDPRASPAEIKTMVATLEQGIRMLKAQQSKVIPPQRLSDISDAHYWANQVLYILRGAFPDRELQLQERPIWFLLLRFDRGVITALLTSALLLYNVLRGLVTYYVGPLRDEEERTHDSPAWSEYRLLWLAHMWISPFLLFSLISGVYQIVEGLGTPVLVTH